MRIKMDSNTEVKKETDAQIENDSKNDMISSAGEDGGETEKQGFSLKSIVTVHGIIFLAVGIISLIVWQVSLSDQNFANFIYDNISYYIKYVFTSATLYLPFSFAELLLLMLIPVLFYIMFRFIYNLIRKPGKKVRAVRGILAAAYFCCFAMFIFTFTFGISYGTTPINDRMGFERRELSADDIFRAMELVTEKANEAARQIKYTYAKTGSTVMPYGIDEMNLKLDAAYKAFLAEHDIFRYIKPRVKPVILSVEMSKIHTTGIYTFFTGEANVNIDFPDYSIPFTAAHEMSHLMGTAREDEANFVAFMVCTFSDDPYILYSGYVSMYEYLLNALYSADEDLYGEITSKTEPLIFQEMRAYSRFFDKYRYEVIAKVTNNVYDSYLKAQKQDSGVKSYGLVIDLAVVYLTDQNKSAE